MYKTEAQAYQSWRRDLKKELNQAQRRQNIYMYQYINGEQHPNMLRYGFAKHPKPYVYGKYIKDIHIANHYQIKVSDCQRILNKYKV